MVENPSCGLAVKVETKPDPHANTSIARISIKCTEQICFAQRLANGKPFDPPCLELIRTVFAAQHPQGELKISGAQFGSCEKALKN